MVLSLMPFHSRHPIKRYPNAQRGRQGSAAQVKKLLASEVSIQGKAMSFKHRMNAHPPPAPWNGRPRLSGRPRLTCRASTRGKLLHEVPQGERSTIIPQPFFFLQIIKHVFLF